MSERTTSMGQSSLLTWGAVFLVLLLIIITAISSKKNTFVSDVEVDIATVDSASSFISKKDVYNLLEAHFAPAITQQLVGELDVERVERVLEEHPFVLDADAFLNAANVLQVGITQRIPVMRVIDNNGLNYYLDVNGEQMPPSPHYAARVRVLTGNVPPYEPDFMERPKHGLYHLFDLNKRLREDPFLDALVEQIYVNNRGEWVFSTKLGKQIIIFGRHQGMEKKLERLKVFYREGLPYKGWNAYKSFDLRYEGQVVCKKR